MSFLNIKDRKEREATIKDYLATMERIKKRNSDDRANAIDYQRKLAEDYEPVVARGRVTKIPFGMLVMYNDLNKIPRLLTYCLI